MEGIMRPHLYLRAYMAGIVVPTLLLLVSMTVFAFFRFYFEVPSQFVLAMPAWPLARAIVFPMAIVPNAWGLWNMLFLALRPRVRLSLGLHGALLPLLLIPGGVALARVFDVFEIQRGMPYRSFRSAWDCTTWPGIFRRISQRRNG